MKHLGDNEEVVCARAFHSSTCSVCMTSGCTTVLEKRHRLRAFSAVSSCVRAADADSSISCSKAWPMTTSDLCVYARAQAERCFREALRRKSDYVPAMMGLGECEFGAEVHEIRETLRVDGADELRRASQRNGEG